MSEKKDTKKDDIEKKEKEKIKNIQGLKEFKEKTIQKLVIEKALLRPEANCCTYNKGYITQECYVCLTCYKETKKYAIICLGCSLKCHDEAHEMISIGFKRHIRCDCGNNNFYINCTLKKNDEMSYDNIENKYNHNMEGKYCYCNEEEDEKKIMIQCFFCEDWFHIEHLNYFGKIEREEEDNDLPYMDLVCKSCIKILKPILLNYNLKKFVYGLMKIKNKEEINDINLLGKKRNIDKEEENEKNEKIKCKRNLIKENELFYNELILQEEEILIDSENFVKEICRCENCKELYKEIGMEFLNNKSCYKDWENRITFDEIINEPKFIEEVQKENNIITVNSIEDSIKDYFNSKEYHRLSYEKQYILQNCARELKNKFSEFINELDHKELTIEDMYIFFMEFKNQLSELKSE